MKAHSRPHELDESLTFTGEHLTQVTVLLRKTKKLKMNQNQKTFTNSILMEKTGENFFLGAEVD